VLKKKQCLFFGAYNQCLCGVLSGVLFGKMCNFIPHIPFASQSIP